MRDAVKDTKEAIETLLRNCNYWIDRAVAAETALRAIADREPHSHVNSYVLHHVDYCEVHEELW